VNLAPDIYPYQSPLDVITYVNGDATVPIGDGNKVIAHIVNDVGAWGAGFVLAVTRRWPDPERKYRDWFAERKKNDFGLGAVQFVKIHCKPEMLFVANMCGQSGLRGARLGPPIRYDALAKCLQTLGERALKIQASIHMPRIGCGLAGATWDRVEPIIEAHLREHSVFVYDYDR
jgi:O-acetyl-ADP-ribose deacetylase (regulator of RNase III)